MTVRKSSAAERGDLGLGADVRSEVFDRALTVDHSGNSSTNNVVKLGAATGPEGTFGCRRVSKTVEECLRVLRRREAEEGLRCGVALAARDVGPKFADRCLSLGGGQGLHEVKRLGRVLGVCVDDVCAPEQPVALRATRTGRQLDDVPVEVCVSACTGRGPATVHEHADGAGLPRSFATFAVRNCKATVVDSLHLGQTGDCLRRIDRTFSSVFVEEATTRCLNEVTNGPPPGVHCKALVFATERCHCGSHFGVGVPVPFAGFGKSTRVISASFSDEVVVEGCRSERNSIGDETKPQPNDRSDLPMLHQWRFNLKTGEVVERKLDDNWGCEFARINEAFIGVRNRYAYAARIAGNNLESGFDGIIKYDLVNETNSHYPYGASRLGGEPIFAPKPDGAHEEDGWVIGFVWDEQLKRSECIILDAKHFEQGPIARVVMPTRVPFGFHSAWVDQKAWQAAQLS